MSEIEAALTFIVPQDTKPYFRSAALTGGAPEIFFKSEERTVTIHDMRPIADDLALDRQGFVLLRRETAVDDLYDDDAIETSYNPEIEKLLKDYSGADRVAIFDHTRRSDNPEGAANPDGLRGPAGRLHVDYTPLSGPIRAGDAIGADEVERILGDGGRIIQINVWRPISGPVRRTPLALADAETVNEDELVATDQIFPDRTGEIFQLAHAATQQFYWAPEIERAEVLLIQGWDSRDGGRGVNTPHGAFSLPGQQASDPARESIETRTFLVFEAGNPRSP